MTLPLIVSFGIGLLIGVGATVRLYQWGINTGRLKMEYKSR